MEENKKEVSVEETKKKNIVPIIIIIVGLLLIGGGVAVKYMGKDAGKEKDKEETPVDDHEVSEDVLKSLIKVIFIEDKDNITYASPLDDVEGTINELDLKKKVEIIVRYATDNKLAETSSDATNCPAGDGECKVMTVENFNKVLKLYGMDKLEVNDVDSIKLVDKNYYFRAKEKEAKYTDAMHNYFSMKMMDEIIINDNIHVLNIDPEKDEINDKMISKEYVFRKEEEKEEYYLYSIRDNSPRQDVE